MKNIFCYELRTNADDYRTRIIKEGYCNLFFDIGFAEGEGLLKGYADVSGYSPISSYVEMPLRAAIDIIVAIIRGILSATDRYMLPWDYAISTKTVFADRTGEKVKLVYIPSEKDDRTRNKGSIPKVMKDFCREMLVQISAEDRESFDEVIDVFDSDGLKPEECLKKLYAIRNKTKTCLDL